MNVWNYEVFVNRETTTPTVVVRESLEIASAFGYSAINPDTRQIDGVSLGGSAELKFTSLNESVRFLATEGGLLNLWKGDIYIALKFENTNSSNATRRSPQRPEKGPIGMRASISVEDYHFRPDAPYREVVAADAEEIFSALCTRHRSPYGYSTDENTLEYPFAQQVDLLASVNLTDKPLTLFWLQYFSVQYVQGVNMATITQLGGIAEELHTGILVRFFNQPWNVSASKLSEINKRWRMANLGPL